LCLVWVWVCQGAGKSGLLGSIGSLSLGLMPVKSLALALRIGRAALLAWSWAGSCSLPLLVSPGLVSGSGRVCCSCIVYPPLTVVRQVGHMDRIFIYLWMSCHCPAAIAMAATITSKDITPSSFINTYLL
jgi:hypothetical protein